MFLEDKLALVVNVTYKMTGKRASQSRPIAAVIEHAPGSQRTDHAPSLSHTHARKQWTVAADSGIAELHDEVLCSECLKRQLVFFSRTDKKKPQNYNG